MKWIDTLYLLKSLKGKEMKRPLFSSSFNIGKKALLFAAIPAMIAFSSCGGGDEGGDDKTKTEKGTDTDTNEGNASNEKLLKKMQEQNMSEYELPVTMLIPKIKSGMGGDIPLVVIHEEGDFKWELIMGEQFHLVIEDMGDIAISVADEKQEHANLSTVYAYEYIEDEEGHILFKQELDKDKAGENLKPYHHMYAVKTIDGYYYTIKSNSLGEFREIDARKMMLSATSMKSNASS
jgi:hypothetical protein